jgi:nicotinic acid mononucleotide adenylyltransferase
MAHGVYPGSFDPLTTAHLAIIDEAIARFELDRLDAVLSRVALAKEDATHQSLDERVAAIERAAEVRPALRALVTDLQLIADIAEGYDVVVVGADKWHQLHDVAFYGGSAEARDAALARLPPLAVAPRRGVAPPPADADVILLDINPVFHDVSSTAVREGRDEWRA